MHVRIPLFPLFHFLSMSLVCYQKKTYYGRDLLEQTIKSRRGKGWRVERMDIFCANCMFSLGF